MKCWQIAICVQTLMAVATALSAQRVHLEAIRMLSQDVPPLPYVELHIGIETLGMQRVQKAGEWTVAADVELTLMTLPDSTPVLKQKEVVYAPAEKDSLNLPGLLRLLVRKPLPPGNYGAVLKAKDAHRKAAPWQAHRSFFYLKAPETAQLAMSDMCLLQAIVPSTADDASPFARYGLRLFPLANGGVYAPEDTLAFLCELYHTASALKVYTYASYFLSQEGNTQPLEGYVGRVKSIAPSATYPIIATLPLRGLQEGNYTLHVVIYTHDGQERIRQVRHVAVRRPLLLSNLANANATYDQLYGYSEQELNDLIPQLGPASNKLEVEFARSLKTFEQKKNYFVNFWEKRAMNTGSGNPQQEASIYLKRLAFANQHYRAGKKPGWTTDRGRVLLEHGPPDEVQQVGVEAEQYAHEIWNYNTLRNQRAVMFVFADMDLSGTNYTLIHSNLNGEVANANWRQNILRTNQNFAPSYNVTSPRQDNPVNTQRID
jgi:GWxTD domain-containing protein